MAYNSPRTLYVFDIDGTLFNTEAYTKVMNGDNLVKKLGHGEIHTHTLAKGEKYDFSEFRTGKLFKSSAKPIDKVLNKAKAIITNHHVTSKIILLTARSGFDDEENFKQTFRDHGIPIDKIEVLMSGKLSKDDLHIPSPQGKAIMLKPYVMSKKYDNIYIWDDIKDNLDALIALSHLNKDINITGYWVDKKGTPMKYSSLNESIKIQIPKNTMSIPRHEMPQVGKDLSGFLERLYKSHGIKHTHKYVYAKDLRSVQAPADFSHKIIKSLIKSKPDLNPILIAKGGEVLDGNHRAAAALTKGNQKIHVIMVHTDIHDLLKHASNDPNTKFRTKEQSEKSLGLIKKVVREAITSQIYK